MPRNKNNIIKNAENFIKNIKALIITEKNPLKPNGDPSVAKQIDPTHIANYLVKKHRSEKSVWYIENNTTTKEREYIKKLDHLLQKEGFVESILECLKKDTYEAVTLMTRMIAEENKAPEGLLRKTFLYAWLFEKFKMIK